MSEGFQQQDAGVSGVVRPAPESTLTGASDLNSNGGNEKAGEEKKQIRTPRKPRPKSEAKTKALEELKNALTLASMASRQMEMGKEQLTVKEMSELMQQAQVPKLNEMALPDYKGFGFFHKSGKKIRYFTLTPTPTNKRGNSGDTGKSPKKRKTEKKVGVEQEAVQQADQGGNTVAQFDDHATQEHVYPPQAQMDAGEQVYQQQQQHQQNLYQPAHIVYGHPAHGFGGPGHVMQFNEQGYRNQEVNNQQEYH